MNDMTLKVLEIVVIVAVILVTRYLIPWFKSNTEINENAILIDLVNAAVMYAEQTMTGGTVKKEAVMNMLQEWLTRKGIGITEDQIDALVEAAVFAMNKVKTN